MLPIQYDMRRVYTIIKKNIIWEYQQKDHFGTFRYFADEMSYSYVTYVGRYCTTFSGVIKFYDLLLNSYAVKRNHINFVFI